MANNFKPFATGSGANVTAQVDYEALPALSSGFLSGKASSAQVNKALRQGTFVSSCLAQFIANELNVDVLDDGNANGFLANLVNALKSSSNGVLNTAFPKRTFSANDFIRIPDVPGGLIIQFGSAIINSHTGKVTFPTPFPNLPLAFIPMKNSDAAARFITFSGLAVTSVNLYGWIAGGSATTDNIDSFNWVAIGF